jgi:hypothetical protein
MPPHTSGWKERLYRTSQCHIPEEHYIGENFKDIALASWAYSHRKYGLYVI